MCVCARACHHSEVAGQRWWRGHPGLPPCPHPIDLAVQREVFSFLYGPRIAFLSSRSGEISPKENEL